MTTDETTTEQAPAYRYATLMNEARAGRLEGSGFKELEAIRDTHPEVAEEWR